jgi:hypothetical protein
MVLYTLTPAHCDWNSDSLQSTQLANNSHCKNPLLTAHMSVFSTPTTRRLCLLGGNDSYNPSHSQSLISSYSVLSVTLHIQTLWSRGCEQAAFIPNLSLFQLLDVLTVRAKTRGGCRTFIPEARPVQGKAISSACRAV